MLASFIIPSYNSAHTVRRCLDSIYSLPLEQSEFEVIFVDDCSTDDTVGTVQNYRNHEGVDNLILLRQAQNNRQGAARNRGLSVATGKYICFVDSDDAVAEGLVTAIRMAEEVQTDMLAFHFANANEEGQITSEKEHLSFIPEQIFSGIEMQAAHPYWCSAPWAYIYSKSFLAKSSYPFCEGILYEDSDFVAAHLYYAQKMAYSPDTGYMVCHRDGSTTHSNSYKNYADYLLLGTRMLTLYSTIQRDIDHRERTDDGIQSFADGVLEGACWNVTKSLSRLFKLNGGKEISAFYKRVDSFVNRRDLYSNPLMHKFPGYWSNWSVFCIKHKRLSVALNAVLSLAYKIKSSFHK